MSKFKLTIGADPEFFMTKGEGANAEVLMACGKFGGGKGYPIILSNEGGYLEDGTAVEFNLLPAPTLKEVQARVFRLVDAFEKKFGVKASRYSSAAFKADELKNFSQAMNIGCAADLWAYGLRTTPSVNSFKNRRFAGGHIHVGLDPWPEGLDKKTFISLLDIMFLIPWQAHIQDATRYIHYGHAGLYRETDYGVEWRSPDNTWCNPAYYELVKNSTINATKDFVTNFDAAMAQIHKVLEKDGHGSRIANIVHTQQSSGLMEYLRSAKKSYGFGSGHRGAWAYLLKHLHNCVSDKSLFRSEVEAGADAPHEAEVVGEEW